ncbi:MAG: hypothetical protein E7680_07210 [Ruminococcaceae bacterium]|nr:hypothetical protein [Oscillospiraceae bacterium]
MLNLICGPSGSGKSAQITDWIRRDVENQKRCYLLLPEQQAYISERDLPKKLPENAGLYFKIVNFSGLCEDVFQKFGGSADLSPDQTGRAVLMWETLRSLSGVLKRYAKSAKSDTALTETMLATIEDLQNNGIGSEKLEGIAADLPQNAQLSEKLYDLSLVSATYSMLVEQRFGKSLPDRFFQLAKTLEQHDYFSGANLYIDSFTSFTAPEYAVLTELIRQCSSVTIGLCLDSFQAPSVQFHCVNETAKRLIKCANKADSPIKRIILTNEENCRPQALRLLERDLWNFGITKKTKDPIPKKDVDCISLLACSNLYEESEAAALNILELVQNGMHYGDIAVFVRDPEQYRGILDAALERHGIPVFFSERTNLAAKPLARLVLSALRAVNGNYRMQDVISLVKTGLCGVTEREASLFEEYCETWRISGKRFLDNVWNMNPDGLEAKERMDGMSERAAEILETANRVRKTVILPLQLLQADLRGSKQLPDRCRAVYDYLCHIDLAKKLSALAEKELALGQVREAGESVRLYDLVKDSLVLLCRLLPESTATAEELQTLLEIVFSHSDLGSVPGVHDCVLIGSAATARAEGVRAAFLLGLTEGDFPKSVQKSGILSGAEQKVLQKYGLDLGTDADQQFSQELFYVYRAVTKPLEKLFLSYPMIASGGETKTPSQAFRRVCFLTDRKPELFHLPRFSQHFAENAEKSNEKYHVSPWKNETELYLSKTKINTFVKCPYSYYCQYVLNLRDKKESLPSRKDDGTFIHYLFEKFLSRMAENGNAGFPTEKAEVEKIVGELVLDYLHTVCPIPLSEMNARLLHLFSRLQSISVAMLMDMISEIKSGNFKPKLFEAKIGKEIPALALPLSQGRVVHLSGSIDRVDLYKQEEQTFVRIIDYKTGSTGFSLKDVKSGKDMQLVFYLYAALKLDPAHFVPAGAYYLRVDQSGEQLSSFKSGFTRKELQSEGENGSKAEKGMKEMTGIEIDELIEEVCEKVVEISEEILSGRAEKTESENACRYCIVRENCNRVEKATFKK